MCTSALGQSDHIPVDAAADIDLVVPVADAVHCDTVTSALGQSDHIPVDAAADIALVAPVADAVRCDIPVHAAGDSDIVAPAADTICSDPIASGLSSVSVEPIDAK